MGVFYYVQGLIVYTYTFQVFFLRCRKNCKECTKPKELVQLVYLSWLEGQETTTGKAHCFPWCIGHQQPAAITLYFCLLSLFLSIWLSCYFSPALGSYLLLLLGHPLFLLLSRSQVRAWHVVLFDGFLRLCPIQPDFSAMSS